MVRKELREHIFKMLFQIEFNDPQEMPEQIEYYFSTLEDAADKDKAGSGQMDFFSLPH